MASRFSNLSAASRTVWAKSGDESGHGLLAHIIDVAAVAEVVLEREPDSTRSWAATTLGVSATAAARWCASLAGLHDFGKATPGFQCKWQNGMLADARAGLPFHKSALAASAHDASTAALLCQPLRDRCGAPPQWIRHVVQAISAHHGYNFLPQEIGNARPMDEGSEWRTVRDELLDSYWELMAPSGTPAIAELSTPAVQWLAGLTSVADWIGSNKEWFPLGGRCDGLADYFADAKDRAANALDSIGWFAPEILLGDSGTTGDLLGRILHEPVQITPRPLQEVGDRLLKNARGPALLLVEAPMGEGKTELAFLAHLRLQAENHHRGFYVALPTKATGNAMFRRAKAFLRGFASARPPDMQLVHGGAALDAHMTHLHDVNHSAVDTISASAWFSQRRRPLLSPCGVGTIDQALFSTLNVKHHFVRLWGLSNRVVVLDEVHAYDTYTTGLIEGLLRWLRSLGSSVVLMSATLPRDKRDALLGAWGIEPQDVPDVQYPRIVLADAHQIQASSFVARPLPPMRLSGIGESLEDIVACAIGQVVGGGCGVIVTNTVDRAQSIYSRLKQQLAADVQLTLFHARFPADWRSAREDLVLRAFGKDGDRPQKALLVATQVVEQSLDVDFDFMLTDLAPVDLILQRAGRVHRHERDRPPAHACPRLFVAGLRPEKLPDFDSTKWRYVYDEYLLARTWALLSRESVIRPPEDIERLVQAVYGSTKLPDDLPLKVRNYIEIDAFGKLRATVMTQRILSMNVAIDPYQEPQNAYVSKPRGNEEGDGLGLTNRTRLGDESIALVPVHVDSEGWHVTPGDPAFDPSEPLTDSIACRLYVRQVQVSRRDIVAHYAQQNPPASFAGHPLLQRLKPLPLECNRFCLGASLVLRLDEELGLVYETQGKHSAEDP